MIPIADLQIGNRVLYNGMEAIVYSIRGPYPDVSERFNNKATVDLILGGLIDATEDEIYPIVLTPELLTEKLGFEEQNNGVFTNGEYKSGNVMLGIVTGSDNQYQLCYCGKWSDKIVKSLHQLQNIFSAIEYKDLLP